MWITQGKMKEKHLQTKSVRWQWKGEDGRPEGCV